MTKLQLVGYIFSRSFSSSFGCIQHLAFVQLLALGPVYPRQLIIPFSSNCHNGRFLIVGHI